MHEETRTEEKPKNLIKTVAKSEVLRNYAGAIAILLGALPAVGSLVVSVVTSYRGEPVAENTWKTVRHKLNRQGDKINELTLRVTYAQAFEDGKTAAAVQALQNKYDLLVAKLNAEPTFKIAGETPSSECKEGRIKIDGRCKVVPKALAKKVKKEEQKAAQAKVRLLEEKRRRLKEEKRRRAAETHVKSFRKSKSFIEPLPARLEDAMQKAH